MSTKDKLLIMLEERKGAWLSGEEVGDTLSVSRAAIWKAVNSLREDGYIIDAVRKRGYRLVDGADILSELGIWKYLSPDCHALDIHVMESVGSTNALLWEKANTGSPEGTVLIASMQTDGKGRLGRRFYSPAETGIYMSILLRPEAMEPNRAIRLTTMAAAAACETITEASGKTSGIKWVNDIFLDGKKVSGILTEGSISMENGLMEAVVLGIGINAYEPEGGFPKELREIAGAVYSEHRDDGKNKLAAGFLNRLMRYYRAEDDLEYVRSYRANSIAIGRKITVNFGKTSQNALALDIDEDCRLVVRYDDQTVEHLSSGEISIKLD